MHALLPAVATLIVSSKRIIGRGTPGGLCLCWLLLLLLLLLLLCDREDLTRLGGLPRPAAGL